MLRARFLFSLALCSFSVLASGLAGGCSSDNPGDANSAINDGQDETDKLPGPVEWNRAVTPLPSPDAEAKRTACAFKAGALPGETLGDQVPFGSKIPIDHFVLVMLENRSFDHYFQKLAEVGVTDAEVAPEGFSNKAGSGKDVTIQPMERFCIADTNHEWHGVHEQYNDGKMDGFVLSNEESGQDGARAMTYLTKDSAPFGYFLAKTYAISDRHFSSLLGPTWPNRMYFYAGSSFGLTKNTLASTTPTTLMDQLEQREIPWTVYRSDTPGAAVFAHLIFEKRDNFKPIANFFDDAKAGTLAPVTYVDPGLVGKALKQTSQHPPANHQYGEQFLYDVVKAVQESPLWERTALVVTYDEHGGFYDHVPPPSACVPDDTPIDEGGEHGHFDRLGIRVPLFVISPYAKKSHVSHTVTDHTSILRLIEARFRLPALTARDANAAAIYDMFDFENAPFKTPPALPSAPTIDEAQDKLCETVPQ